MVRLSNVQRTYGSGVSAVRALDDVSLTIGEGEFVSLVGPSGCGKSTLLRLVAGLDSPDAGIIEVSGQRSRGPSADNGIVFQQPTLLQWRTALANVMLPMEIQEGRGRRRRREQRGRAATYLDLVGLSRFANHYPNQLSGGMQQRVAIARALATDPRVLLMDEPFGALDAMTREQLNIELLRIWATTGKTVLFVTHSVEEAVLMSDRVVIMSNQPARIVDDFAIPLARPRALEMLTSEEGAHACAKVRKLLETASSDTNNELNEDS